VPVRLGRHPVVAAFFPDVPGPDEHAAEGEGRDSGALVDKPSADELGLIAHYDGRRPAGGDGGRTCPGSDPRSTAAGRRSVVGWRGWACRLGCR
jgi:hypothetical protein